MYLEVWWFGADSTTTEQNSIYVHESSWIIMHHPIFNHLQSLPRVHVMTRVSCQVQRLLRDTVQEAELQQLETRITLSHSKSSDSGFQGFSRYVLCPTFIIDSMWGKSHARLQWLKLEISWDEGGERNNKKQHCVHAEHAEFLCRSPIFENSTGRLKTFADNFQMSRWQVLRQGSSVVAPLLRAGEARKMNSRIVT